MSKIVEEHEFLYRDRSLRAEVRDDGSVTLSVHPFVDKSTVKASVLRELAQRADDAYVVTDRVCRGCGKTKSTCACP
jgi:hypothetical protein